jgi:hypothetical protein
MADLRSMPDEISRYSHIYIYSIIYSVTECKFTREETKSIGQPIQLYITEQEHYGYTTSLQKSIEI